MTDAKSNDVGYSYDDQDRIKTVTDQNGNVTTYNYNEYGDLTSLVSQATGTTTFIYDNAGNVTKRADARGLVTDYSYDALNRLTSVSYPGNAQENVTYQYDDTTAGNHGIGRLTSIVNSDASLTFVYDERGNTTEVIQAVSGEFYSTEYAYDAADRVIQITYPSGRLVQYVRDATGQITAVTTQANASAATEVVANTISHQPFGPVNSLTQGNGLATTASYDSDYRLTQLTTGSSYHKVFSYDLADNITGIADGLDPLKTQSFSYDELYYLSQDIGQYGEITYTYDAAGNRLTQTHTLPQTLEAGQLLFTYNQANRMASVSRDGSLLATYKYNALGQRVEKARADNTTTTVYFYDLNGQVIGQQSTNGTTTDTQDIIWLGSRPIAQYSNGTVVYIHTDQLNTPRLATDQTQTTVWRWDSDAFGVGEAANDPDGNGDQVTIALRFPGQLHDDETGLHYNYFRDYDPSIGKYIQPDPIGQNAGTNLYRYVSQNPMRLIDPYGLMENDCWSYTDSFGQHVTQCRSGNPFPDNYSPTGDNAAFPASHGDDSCDCPSPAFQGSNTGDLVCVAAGAGVGVATGNVALGAGTELVCAPTVGEAINQINNYLNCVQECEKNCEGEE